MKYKTELNNLFIYTLWKVRNRQAEISEVTQKYITKNAYVFKFTFNAANNNLTPLSISMVVHHVTKRFVT